MITTQLTKNNWIETLKRAFANHNYECNHNRHSRNNVEFMPQQLIIHSNKGNSHLSFLYNKRRNMVEVYSPVFGSEHYVVTLTDVKEYISWVKEITT